MKQRNLFAINTFSKAFLFLSLGLYLSCLLQDSVFCVNGSCSGWPGWSILLIGILAIPLSPANMTWLANPMILAGWLMLWLNYKTKRRIIGIICIITGASSSIVSFLFSDMKFVVTNEAGISMPITGLGAGYWLWVLSTTALTASAICQCIELSRARSRLDR